LVILLAATEERRVRAALQPLAAAVQVDLPADELAGEAHVLAVAADGQRQLVLVHDGRDDAARGVADDLGDLGRRECATREDRRVRVPRHDVDALAAQLADDGLHARALEAHARAHRVDRVVARRHGNLRAAADLARDALDLDDALVRLRHLELEERGDEHGVGARQDEARPLGRLLDALEHCADGLALTEPLARVLLLPRNDRVGIARLVQHHDDLAALDLLHLTGEQLADLAGVLVANLVALALAHALDDALLRGHHGVAAELLELDGDLEHVADLEVGVVPARLLERDLTRRVLDLVHDLLQDRDHDVAARLVDLDLGLD